MIQVKVSAFWHWLNEIIVKPILCNLVKHNFFLSVESIIHNNEIQSQFGIKFDINSDNPITKKKKKKFSSFNCTVVYTS